jgi:hypothetical protein
MLILLFYTPFLRTVFLVLTCHPLYQCAFGRCYDDPTPSFIVSAYCGVTVLVFFGIGTPLVLIWVLWRRYRYFRLAFRRDEHHTSPYEDEDGNVDIVQWNRYLTSDDSALSALYRQLLPSRIAYQPLFLLAKLLLLLPAVLIEPNTPQQIVGIGVAEVLFALFVLLMSPFMSPWIDMLVRFGSSHQCAVLALQAYYAVEKASKDDAYVGPDAVRLRAGHYMSAVSTAYVSILGLFVVVSLLRRFGEDKYLDRIHKALFDRFGITPVSILPMFIFGSREQSTMSAPPLRDEAGFLDDDDLLQHKAQVMRHVLRFISIASRGNMFAGLNRNAKDGGAEDDSIKQQDSDVTSPVSMPEYRDYGRDNNRVASLSGSVMAKLRKRKGRQQSTMELNTKMSFTAASLAENAAKRAKAVASKAPRK